MAISKEVKDKWIEALRTGDFWMLESSIFDREIQEELTKLNDMDMKDFIHIANWIQENVPTEN